MINLLTKYFENLANNPERIDAIYLWTLSTFVVWTVMVVYRKKMIEGASGDNGFFETAEQVTYIMTWMFPAITFYSVYFKVELSSWVWYFMTGVTAYAIGGRWIFEWVLALRSGSSKVDDTGVQDQKKTEVNVSVKTDVNEKN